MKVLITAGSTIVPIDKVRVISNIFHGQTGTNIAKYFHDCGDEVTLVTSSPKLLDRLHGWAKVKIMPYRTFTDLEKLMKMMITGVNFDVIIHSAAVSDCLVTGACVKNAAGQLVPLDKKSKISSSHQSLYLEMAQTPKLIDLIRDPWGFTGQLVKFKLEVGISDDRLLEIARNSRAVSDADFIVANCLEWSDRYAHIVGRSGRPVKVKRSDLPARLREELLS